MSQKSSETKTVNKAAVTCYVHVQNSILKETFRRICHLLPFHITNNELRSFILINALYKWKVIIN